MLIHLHHSPKPTAKFHFHITLHSLTLLVPVINPLSSSCLHFCTKSCYTAALRYEKGVLGEGAMVPQHLFFFFHLNSIMPTPLNLIIVNTELDNYPLFYSSDGIF